MADIDKMFDFFHEAGKLKSTYRFSESDALRGKESSADHSWRLSLMSFMVAEELGLDLDIRHALKIAIVHDLAESVAGDVDVRLIHSGKVSKQEKLDGELKAMQRLASFLPKKHGNEVYSLWKEYEDGSSIEARYIKALDKLETLTYIIEAGHEAIDVPEIIANYADEAVGNFPELSGLLKIIKKKLRTEFEKASIPWKESYG